ncbi:hypothetical protein FQR65_LT10263 [Abscondita terminalis]|nr:hypothetical protein FQR65_LT10263 [Abscondita terminalis]
MINIVTKIQAILTLLIIVLMCISIYMTLVNQTSIENKKIHKSPYENVHILKKELDDASLRVLELEKKITMLETRVPKKYAEVTFLNYLKKKRILITGGAGFVGSHLVDTLMLQGHDVIVVDNFFTGRRQNVVQWIGHENFELIHHDIVNPLFIEVDQIYHLASPASPPHYMQNPVKTIKTNTLGTINMLGLARRVNATILIASTSEVYGDPDKHPQSESYWGHVNPIGAYNHGKIVLYFLTNLEDTFFKVYGSGNQTRSFQYVSDLVDGLISLMESNYTLPVNIGNPVEHTINEFATIIKDLVGGKSEVKHVAEVEDDPQRRRPDITRAKMYLKWEPKISLSVGLQKTVDYFKKELKSFKFVYNSSSLRNL